MDEESGETRQRRSVERAVVGTAADRIPCGSAGRTRAHRARQARGEAVLQVTVNLVAVEEMLVAAKLLAEWQRDDRKKVEAAVGALLADWCE